MYRKLNSLAKMDYQEHHSQMGGKERQGYMQLGSQGEGYLVHPRMPQELLKILAKFGKTI